MYMVKKFNLKQSIYIYIYIYFVLDEIFHQTFPFLQQLLGSNSFSNITQTCHYTTLSLYNPTIPLHNHVICRLSEI